MLAMILLAISVCFGYLITRRFFPSLAIVEKIAIGIIIGTLISTWFTFLLSLVIGFTPSLVVTTSFMLVMIGLQLNNQPIRYLFNQKELRKKVRRHLNLMVFSFFWLLLFATLFQHHMLRHTKQGWFTAGNSYGDLALHATYSNYFASQEKIQLNSPVYATEPIQYPFLSNFHSAMLLKLGLPLHWVLVIVGVGFSTSIVVLLYQLSYRITASKVASWLTPVLYLLNGPFSFGYFIKSLREQNDWLYFLQHLPTDFGHQPELGYHWTNLITTHLLPQRGFMFGLALLVVVLLLWQVIWEQKKIKLQQLIPISLIIGLLPFFHSHSFLVLTPLHSWLLFWGWQQKKLGLVQALSGFVTALSVGLPQVLFLYPQTEGDSFARWQIGWMAKETPLLLFWLKNMGWYFIGLTIGTTIFFWRYAKQYFFLTLLLIPFAAIFVLNNLIIFQPNEWDNMKFFMLGNLVPSLVAAFLLQQMIKRHLVIFAGTIIVTAIGMGLTSITYELQTNYQVASSNDIEAGREINKIIPAGSIFLTGDAHNHLVPMIAGRATVLGYRGWLWTHGIDYGEVEDLVRQSYAGTNQSREALVSLGVDYVYIGYQEKKLYDANQNYFKENFDTVWQSDNLNATIYQVNQPD